MTMKRHNELCKDQGARQWGCERSYEDQTGAAGRRIEFKNRLLQAQTASLSLTESEVNHPGLKRIAVEEILDEVSQEKTNHRRLG